MASNLFFLSSILIALRCSNIKLCYNLKKLYKYKYFEIKKSYEYKYSRLEKLYENR